MDHFWNKGKLTEHIKVPVQSYKNLKGMKSSPPPVPSDAVPNGELEENAESSLRPVVRHSLDDPDADVSLFSDSD